MTTTTGDTAVAPGSAQLDELLGRIAEGAERRERERIPPFVAIGWLRDAGFGRLRIPIEEGGAGASVPELFEVLIDLAAADANVCHILRAHFWFTEQVVANQDPAARARQVALVRAGGLVGNAVSEQGSRPVGLFFDTAFSADADRGGYRLNGTKYYSTGSMYCDHIQIWAAAPERRIAGAVVPIDRDGLTIEDDWDGFGQRLTGTGTTRLDDVRISSDEFFDLGAEGADQPPSYQGAFLQLYLQMVTAGILRNVRDDAVALSRRRRRNFSHAGAAQATDDRQVLQVIGEIAADAFAAEAIVLRAAGRLQDAYESLVDGVPSREAADLAQRAAAEAKVAIDATAPATAAKLFDVGGASATQSKYNLDRHWRNVRTLSTHNPTFLKASAVGDHFVNGTSFPANAYF